MTPKGTNYVEELNIGDRIMLILTIGDMMQRNGLDSFVPRLGETVGFFETSLESPDYVKLLFFYQVSDLSTLIGAPCRETLLVLLNIPIRQQPA
jgi:hypothetical protein